MYWFCVTEVESVFCDVRSEPLYNTDMFAFEGLNHLIQPTKHSFQLPISVS